MKNKSPIGVIRGFLIAITCMLANDLFAQNPSIEVFEDWNLTSGTQNNFQRSIVRSKTVGGATYYYTCGSTINSSGNYDILVQKKNASGVVLWSQTYSGAGNAHDYGADVQVASSGSVYVCGTYYKDATDSNNAIIIKYNASGTQQWAYTYNGAGSRHDVLAAMQLSTAAIVGVGATYKGSMNLYDMLAVRVDTNGNQVWAQTWDYANMNDVAVNLYNSGTKVYIAGGAQSAISTYKYAVFNVKFSDGSIQGSTTTGGTAFGFDQLTDIQYDLNGNIYLTGGVINTGTAYDIKTVKLDTALNILWSATYASSGAYNDVGTGLAIDQVGNVIVTGYRTSATTGKDYVTIKYSSGGTQRWVSTFDGGINADDSATCVVVSPTDTNKIYMSGFSNNGSSKDYMTVKYDGAGNQKWNIGFNHLLNGDDRATAIALDSIGDIVVSGQNKLNDSTYEYTTVKYVEKSTLLPDDTISYTSSSFVFTENRGQLLGTDTLEHPEIKYYCNAGIPSVYFMDTAVSYVFFKADTTTANVDSLYRIDMKFVNSNPNLRVRALEASENVSNYYLGHIPEGRCRVQNYDQLISTDVWNNVSILWGSNLRGLKTYFICQPGGGGNPATQIDLLFEDADSVKVDGTGQLIVYSPYGMMIHPKAAIWQIDGSGNFQSLGWQPNYNIIGTNEVKFTSFGSYNTAYPLVIAMDWGNEQLSTVANPIWSTYLGSPDTDYGWDIEYNNGEVFALGNTSASAFPVYNGYDVTHNGSHDIYIGCFDSQRVKKWVTYYGGNSDDMGYDLTFVNSYVLCTGNTSSNNFPLFSPAGYYAEGSLSSVTTAYILMLNPFNGYMQWATRFGRTQTQARAILADPIDNDVFYLAGYTINIAGNVSCGPPTNTGLPLCDPGSGAYYDATPNGGQDGFIARFSNMGQLTWSTFFGGAGLDGIVDLAATANGSLYAVGYTESSSGFPVQTPTSGTYYQSTFSGVRDGFLVEFNLSTLSNDWCTYVGGASTDQITNVDILPNNSLYVVGQTASIADATTCGTPTGGGFPTCTNLTSYSQPLFAGFYGDAFILKFKAQNLVWGTYLGGTGSEGFPNYFEPDLTHDANGNIYIALATTSPENVGGTPAITQFNAGMNYNQNNCADVSVSNYYSAESIIYTFTASNQMLWGSYFGGIGTANVPTEIGDMPTAIDCAGNNLIITGFLHSTSQFPVVAPILGSFIQGPTTVYAAPGGGDVFITEFDISQIPNSVPDSGIVSTTFIVNVAPNPVGHGSLSVTVTSAQMAKFDLKIFNVIGNVVYSSETLLSANTTTEISVENLANGIYFIQVIDESGISQTVKIAIEK